MPTTFPITIGPEWGNAQKQQNLRLLENDFGDGYGQRAGDGINVVRATYTLQWTNLDPGTADYADLFLTELGGTVTFLWQPPRSTIPLLFICKQWGTSGIDPNAVTFTATFIQVFDL